MAIMTRPYPKWAKEAKKVMIDRDLTVCALAEELRMARPHISRVITGALISPNTKAAICRHLGVTDKTD